MPYERFVDVALYDPEHGFYRAGGRAGRRGDFLTSPEVGPLFGHVVANAIDAEWVRLGRPDDFTVVDAGAGPGTLARTVLAADPECRDALDYVAVESSESQRALHPDGIRSVDELPTGFVGMVIANELLDNLTFAPVRRVSAGWERATVAIDGDDLVVAWDPVDEPLPIDPAVPSAVFQPGALAWLRTALTAVQHGRVIVIDYARADSADVEIRTYAHHGRAGDPLAEVGLKDITVDVDLAQLQTVVPAAVTSSQADWLRRHGIDQLVEEGRRVWEASASVGDLAALKMRSRIREADALLEPTGLGGFTVAEWQID